MSHALVEAATYDATVVVPDDGDTENAASVITGMQSLADRTKYLRQQALGATSSTAVIPLTLGVCDNSIVAAAWDFQFGGWIEVNKSAGEKITFDFVPPDRCTLTGIAVYCTGNVLGGAAHGALPATKPKLTYQELTPNNPNPPTVSFTSNISDNPAGVVAYEQYHVLGGGSGLALARVVDAANVQYRITIQGEELAGSLNSYFAISGIFYTFTAP